MSTTVVGVRPGRPRPAGNPEGQAVVIFTAGDGFFKTVDCLDRKKS
ncbi:hypothetical protein [Streptomyces sp. NPDC059957]